MLEDVVVVGQALSNCLKTACLYIEWEETDGDGRG
jgi:hypothetical protein